MIIYIPPLASDHQLAFNLDDLRKLSESTDQVCSSLIENKNSLKAGLDQLRIDWQTDGGRYFFSCIDQDWEKQVDKFEDTIKTFKSVIDDAIAEFEKVKEKTDQIGKGF